MILNSGNYQRLIITKNCDLSFIVAVEMCKQADFSNVQTVPFAQFL